MLTKTVDISLFGHFDAEPALSLTAFPQASVVALYNTGVVSAIAKAILSLFCCPVSYLYDISRLNALTVGDCWVFCLVRPTINY